MGLLKSVRLELARMMNLDFGEVETNHGILLYEGDEINEGDEVFIRNADGELEVPADGEYETEAQIITVEAGIVTNITDKDSGSDDGGSSEGGDMKEVSREEFNKLLNFVSNITRQMDKTAKIVNEINADFQKFRKAPAGESANKKVEIKDKGGMSKEELFCRGEID